MAAGFVFASAAANAQVPAPYSLASDIEEPYAGVRGSYAAVLPEAPLRPADGPRLLPPLEVYTVLREGRFSPLGIPRLRGFVYTIAVLDPTASGPADLPYWNRKLIYYFGGGVAIGHYQGSNNSDESRYPYGLGKGYATDFGRFGAGRGRSGIRWRSQEKASLCSCPKKRLAAGMVVGSYFSAAGVRRDCPATGGVRSMTSLKFWASTACLSDSASRWPPPVGAACAAAPPNSTALTARAVAAARRPRNKVTLSPHTFVPTRPF